MTRLTFNNQQLLFVRVPMEAGYFSILEYNNNDILSFDPDTNTYYGSFERMRLPYKCNILGTIQKSGGIVSTTIENEVLEELVEKMEKVSITDSISIAIATGEKFLNKLQSSGLELKEGDKYVVLKVK